MLAHKNSETIDIKAVTKQIHRTIVEDGLLDIMIGIALILSTFHLMGILSYFWILWVPIAVVLTQVVRRRFIYPRTGYVNFSLSAGQVASIFGLSIAVIALLTILLALIATGIGKPIKENWREILNLSLIAYTVLFFCFIAFQFNAPRWYMHGILMGGAFLLGRAFEAHGIVIALGIWIILVGTYVFLRFIQRFPIEPTEDASDVR